MFADIQKGRRGNQDPGRIWIPLFIIRFVDAGLGGAWISSGGHVFVVLLCVIPGLEGVLGIGNGWRRGIILHIFVGGWRGARGLVVLIRTVLPIAIALVPGLFLLENTLHLLKVFP
jgi:hypothetical protein